MSSTLKGFLEKGVSEDLQWDIKAQGIEKEIKGLTGRLQTLEEALLNSPEKALAVPLLRKEVDSLEKVVAITRIETERFYTILLAVSSLMITIALGALGIVFSKNNQS